MNEWHKIFKESGLREMIVKDANSELIYHGVRKNIENG